ncbi:MAG TPA: phosphoribosyltransferase family protein [Candidatus Bathyarchaeia archaeon]|nr:phosphoribosyltransferase family protein [Candidatus Bathyarchaeia archaeon]
MDQYPFFIDRTDAGNRLAEKLTFLSQERLVVLPILNGGVPIAAEIVKKYSCPLDILLVHKLHYPGKPEFGFGAVSFDGTILLNQEAIKNLSLNSKETELIIKEAFSLLKKRKEAIIQNRLPVNLFFKTALIVDDGLATGYTMLVAIRAIKKRGPKKIIVAIPAASHRGLNLVKNEIEEAVCLYTHPEHYPFKIAASYQKWHTIEDKEVNPLLIARF